MIAEQYGISQQALEEANEIENPDWIKVGQVLVIPISGVAAPATSEPVEFSQTDPITATPEAQPTGAVDVEILSADYPAQLSGNLTVAYPEEQTTSRFTIHYTPGTYVERDLDNVVAILSRGLQHIESQLDAEISGDFDIYVAGSLFGAPNLALRGRSFSANRNYFFLHDSTGNDADQQYIATHEMTHLFAWNVFGRPVSAMLSEGVAVYTGITAIADSDHLPVREFCGAYHRAGRLPRVTSGLRFEGHIRDLENYYAAGCFVQYLIETYGAERFGDLYPTGNYTAVYDQTLSELEAAWIDDLESGSAGVSLDTDALFAASDAVAEAYDLLFAQFSATEEEWLAYTEIDAARLALLEGRFDDVEVHLNAAERYLGET
jgi:murein DD-endopeptidase MepM/ murein hydrolase activator NlpD